MPIGLGAAMLIGSAVAGGGAVASAVIQSKAAKSAAQTQAQAGEQALGLQKQIYEQQRADLAPWRDTGQQALGALSGLMGLGGGGTGGGQSAPSLAAPAAPETDSQTLAKLGLTGPQLGTSGATGGPGYYGNNPLNQNYSSYAPQSNPAPKILMRAPDGTTQAVDAQLVPHYQQLGAVPMGRA